MGAWFDAVPLPDGRGDGRRLRLDRGPDVFVARLAHRMLRPVTVIPDRLSLSPKPPPEARFVLGECAGVPCVRAEVAIDVSTARRFRDLAMALSRGGLHPVVLAAHARALMLHSASAEKVANLNEALTRSREIGTAVGILMAMHRVTSENAFEMLSRASQDLNRKLRDVAEDVTRTGALPQPLRSRDGRT